MGNESSTPSSRSAASSRNQRQAPTTQTRAPPPPPQQQQQTQVQQRRGSLTAPGAYKMPGQPANGQRFYVTIPRGVQPGQHFRVLVNGEQMMVRCPDGMRPGDRLIVTSPRERPQQYVVQVPQGIRPGQQFPVMIQNQQIMVTCPQGVRPGERVTFNLPTQQTQNRPAVAPNHQLFEATVPEGVRPGQPFALIANNQRVMVTCPPNVRPGQKIRFQLPITLDEHAVQSYKVSYDKDGWMRCLGVDMQFHWVYNEANQQAPDDDRSDTRSDVDAEESKQVIEFDIDRCAYVRRIVGAHPNRDLEFVPASEYAIPTVVKGTQVTYQMLSNVAMKPFPEKVEWLKEQFKSLRTPWEEGHIRIRVRRQYLLQDSMDAIESIDDEDMHKIFRYEFIDEPALDAGGVAREWFTLLAEQLFNPAFGLFQYSAVNQMCLQINPNSGIANEFHLRYFHMAGRFLGKAIMDGQVVPAHLVQPLYKHLLGWPVILKDLEHVDDVLYRSLMEMLTMEDVSMLYLDFTVTEDHMGITETVELVPGGAEKMVENSNVAEYLEANLKYRLHERLKEQLLELLKGFSEVVPEPLLSVFDFQEIELLLCGLPNIDMDDWIANTEYTGDFAAQGANHKVVQWFWEAVRDMSQDQRAKLLQFTTGTAGVPVQGFAFLQGNDGNIRKFALHGAKAVKVFPRAHTCFNRLDVPIYKTKAELQHRLTQAITMEATGFGIE